MILQEFAQAFQIIKELTDAQKKTFSRGNRDNKKAVKRDEGKVNDIRERAWFFQGQRAKIRLA